MCFSLIKMMDEDDEESQDRTAEHIEKRAPAAPETPRRASYQASPMFWKGLPANGHVRFTPKSGHVRSISRCLLWAKSGHGTSHEPRVSRKVLRPVSKFPR